MTRPRSADLETVEQAISAMERILTSWKELVGNERGRESVQRAVERAQLAVLVRFCGDVGDQALAMLKEVREASLETDDEEMQAIGDLMSVARLLKIREIEERGAGTNQRFQRRDDREFDDEGAWLD